MKNMKIISIVMGLLAGLLFGIATPLSKLTLFHLNSFQLAGLLYIGAAIAFLPYVVRNRTIKISTLIKTGKKKYLIGIIVFGGLLGPLFLMLGIRQLFNSNY
jgi:drug/metabolite transporter (DMT)-like permease